MTAEERALALRKRLLAGKAPLLLEVRLYPTALPEIDAAIASAIRAAEDEALERAALALGEHLDLEGYIAHEPDTRLTRESAMEIVRSCKSGSVKGDRDGR